VRLHLKLLLQHLTTLLLLLLQLLSSLLCLHSQLSVLPPQLFHLRRRQGLPTRTGLRLRLCLSLRGY